MHLKIKHGISALASLAALALLSAPAAAQWRYYNGYQASPPPNYSYPAYPGGGQPGRTTANRRLNRRTPPSRRINGPMPARCNACRLMRRPYNPPPDDDAAAGTKHTREEVDYPSSEQPGTIIVDTSSKHLYLIEGNGRALQYGIGVGREGFAWKGVAQVHNKQEWPKWFPPSDMLQRRPDLPQEMDGGLGNPLGARALYLWENGKDTLYRIHGTNEPDSIGQAVSSGCIRMMNGDVMDLYNRVPVGTKVIVL
ncbi:MAG: L,D-transpeptidase [Methylovirgula sp.]